MGTRKVWKSTLGNKETRPIIFRGSPPPPYCLPLSIARKIDRYLCQKVLYSSWKRVYSKEKNVLPCWRFPWNIRFIFSERVNIEKRVQKTCALCRAYKIKGHRYDFKESTFEMVNFTFFLIRDYSVQIDVISLDTAPQPSTPQFWNNIIFTVIFANSTDDKLVKKIRFDTEPM